MSFLLDDKKLVDALIKAADKSALKMAQYQAQIPEDEIQKAYQDYFTKNRNPATYENYKNWYIQQKHQTAYKQTQDHPTISPQALEAYKLARKLILGLRSQIITDPNDPQFVKKSAPLDFGAEQAPDIKPENLRTLGDFLTWAATYKIMWEGKRIAWDYNPGDPDATPPIPPSGEKPDVEDPWVFQSYQKGRDRNQYTREAVTKTYYANKDGLLKFLTYLRDTPAAKENKVFEVMIGKVISQVNNFLTQEEKIGPRPQDKPSAQFNDGDLIDGFPTNVMDVKKAYEGIDQYAPAFSAAPQRLTYGDIKDFGALQSWVSGMRDAATPNVDPTSPEGNPCNIIHILYLRAKYLSGQARYDRLRPKYTDLAKVYLTNITNFGKQFTFNGQACAVTQPGVGPGGEPGKQPGQQGQGQGGLSAASPQMLYQLSSLKPFNAQYISFPEIKRFVELYAKYANDPDVNQMASTISRYMDTFKSYLGQSMDTFQLNNIDSNRFKSMLRNGNEAVLASDLLYNIITYAGQLYQRLVVSLQTIAQDSEKSKYIDYRAMQQQVTPGGPQQTNVTSLDDLRQRLQRDWNARK